jgi:hypothetical protein
VSTIGASGALSKLMEMAGANGGKNPLTPLSNADIAMLGNSVANLDPTQSDANFQKNLKVYRDIFVRAYRATGGEVGNDGEPVGLTTEAQRKMAAGFGANEKAQDVPPEIQRANAAFLAGWDGNPDSYVNFRQELDKQFGYQSPTEDYRAWAVNAAKARAQGQDIPTVIPPMKAPMSKVEQLRNNAVNNPVGAFVAGAADAGGLGIPSMLAREQMDALAQDHQLAVPLGQILGAVGATSGLGMMGRKAATAVGLERLLGGGKGAQFARNMATDTAYGGAYGGIANGDPLTGAAAGAVGSAAGQGVGKALGAAVGGLEVPAITQQLRARGIPLTPGQMMGGIPKSIEDAMTSLPGAGDMILARRLEGVRGFNDAAMRDAGAPVGATPNGIGERGVQDLLGQIGNAYDNATAGVRMPLDEQFGQDMAAARALTATLPEDLARKYDLALTNRVSPIEQAGELTGDAYQQSFRGLKSYRAENTKPGFEQDYRNAITSGMDALTGQMQRGGGAEVVQGLANADKAYRAAKTIEDAVKAARNGSRSGEIQTFTPSQLNDAATKSANKYGGGRQFSDLIDAGQSVLPSQIPDSGTGRRLMQNLAMTGALGGGAAGYAGLTGDYENTMKAAALLGLLTAGGTKAGQRVINDALTVRPEALLSAGRKIRKRQGMFGAAAVPLFLEEFK